MSVRLAVFASGGGSNLQALIDRFSHSSQVTVALVVSDRAGAGALERARAAGVPAIHIAVTGRPVDDVAAEMLGALAAHRIDLIAAAGYLRLVPVTVVQQYRERILNIHPALLPSFGGAGMYGARVHEAVIAAGCRVSGATVHYVDEEYDRGRIIAQWPVPVLHDDTAATLAARVLRVEHRLYPAVVELIARQMAAARAANADAPAADVDAAAAGVDAMKNTLAAIEAFRLGDEPPAGTDMMDIASL